MCLGCVLKVFYEDDIQPEIQGAPRGFLSIGTCFWHSKHLNRLAICPTQDGSTKVMTQTA